MCCKLVIGHDPFWNHDHIICICSNIVAQWFHTKHYFSFMVHRTTKLGQHTEHSFSIAAPVVWNSLPPQLHSPIYKTPTISSRAEDSSLQGSLHGQPLRTFVEEWTEHIHLIIHISELQCSVCLETNLFLIWLENMKQHMSANEPWYDSCAVYDDVRLTLCWWMSIELGKNLMGSCFSTGVTCNLRVPLVISKGSIGLLLASKEIKLCPKLSGISSVEYRPRV